MNKPYIALVFGLSFLLLGCLQTPEPATKYVCPDGTTTVTELGSCPEATTPPVTQPVTQYVCSDGETIVSDLASCPGKTPQETEMETCSGMPSLSMAPLEDICIIGIAGKYNDSSLCTEVSRDQRVGCYMVVAKVRGDPDVCLEAGSDSDKCYEQYAGEEKDGSICGKIDNANQRDNCYANLAGQLSDPSLCGEIQIVNQKDNCYFNIAMHFGDSSYCDEITNSDQKQSCIQNLESSTPEKW